MTEAQGIQQLNSPTYGAGAKPDPTQAKLLKLISSGTPLTATQEQEALEILLDLQGKGQLEAFLKLLSPAKRARLQAFLTKAAQQNQFSPYDLGQIAILGTVLSRVFGDMIPTEVKDALNSAQKSSAKKPDQAKGPVYNPIISQGINPVDLMPVTLKDLPLAAMQSGMGETLQFNKGEKIVIQGTKSDCVYIIVEGGAEAEIIPKEGEPYKTKVDYPVVGEMGVLLKTERTANVYATEPTTVIRLESGDFFSFLKANPSLSGALSDVIAQRYASQAEQFFYNEDSVQKLFAQGELPASKTKHPKGETTIHHKELLTAYEADGSRGVAHVISDHVVDEALDGNEKPLEHWKKIMNGTASATDVLYIFEMFETGQLHLHPARSCTPEFVMEVGREMLSPENFNAGSKKANKKAHQKYWDSVQAKINSKPYLKAQLAATGYKHIREIIEAGDLGKLKMLMEYTPAAGAGNLNEYLQVGGFISSMVYKPEHLTKMAYDVAMAQYKTGVRVMELRFSIDAKGSIQPQQVLDSYLKGLEQAMRVNPDMKCKGIVIFDTVMSTAEVNALVDTVLEYKKSNPALGELIVGADTAGPEVGRTKADLKELPGAKKLGGSVTVNGQTEWFFDINKFAEPFAKLKAAGIQITSHGGENFFTLEAGLEAIKARVDLGVVRIGHGVILGIDIRGYIETLPTKVIDGVKFHVDIFGEPYTEVRIVALEAQQIKMLELVAKKGVVIEACPDSNLHTSPLSYESHPIKKMKQHGVQVTISNDNAVLDKTSGPKQILEIARAQNLSFGEILDVIMKGSSQTMDAVVLSEVSQAAKVPLDGVLVEVPEFTEFLELRALANNPTVSQFEFVNEVIERFTKLFPEAQASFIKVNGNTLFGKKTFSGIFATRMGELYDSFTAKFEANWKKYEKGLIGKQEYIDVRDQLKLEFEQAKFKLLGGKHLAGSDNVFNVKHTVKVGNETFEIEIAIVADSPAGMPKGSMIDHYRKNMIGLLEEFFTNNVEMQQKLKDPLTSKNMQSQQWAKLKLDRAAEYYRACGKKVVFGIFDVDYFKGFNAGGNYLLGDDAIKISNIVAENSVRVQDQIELFRNGGDEGSILFVDTDKAGAKAAMIRINKVMKLVTSVPLGETLSIDHPAVKEMMLAEGLTEKQAQHIVDSANTARAEILLKIKKGKFRHITTVEQFNQIFCEPRLVADVFGIGQTISLDSGKVKFTVTENGKLVVETPQQKLVGEIKYNQEGKYSKKLNIAGKEYVVVIEQGNANVKVLHKVKGMQISGGVGETFELANDALGAAKKAGKGTALGATEKSSYKKSEVALNDTKANPLVYEHYEIAQNISSIWEKMRGAFESTGAALHPSKAKALYFEAFAATFGKNCRVVSTEGGYRVEIGGVGGKVVDTIKIGTEIIEVTVAGNDPLLLEAAKEFSKHINLSEQTRQNLDIIAHAGEVDLLTGLKSTSAIQSIVGNLLKSYEKVNIYFYDIDDFKGVNEKFGYKTADGFIEVVSMIDKLSAKYFINGYAESRLMGDEFLIANGDMSQADFLAAMEKMNVVRELVMGVDPEIEVLVVDAEGYVELESGKKIKVSPEVLKAANEVRGKIIGHINDGHIKNLNFKQFRKVIVETRKGRSGEVAGGFRFAGGYAKLTMADLANFTGTLVEKLEKASKRAIEIAGEMADAAKKLNKASDATSEVREPKIETNKEGIKPKAENQTTEIAKDQQLFETAKEAELKLTEVKGKKPPKFMLVENFEMLIDPTLELSAKDLASIMGKHKKAMVKLVKEGAPGTKAYEHFKGLGLEHEEIMMLREKAILAYHKPKLLDVIAQLKKAHPKLAEFLEAEITRLTTENPNKLAELSTKKLGKLTAWIKKIKKGGKFGAEKEAWVKEALEALGCPEAMVKSTIIDLRWMRLRGRYGVEVLDIVKNNPKAAEALAKSPESFKSLMVDLYGAYKGNSEALQNLRDLGFSENKIGQLKKAVAEVAENYIKTKVSQFQQIQNALAQGTTLDAVTYSKYKGRLLAINKNKGLKKALKAELGAFSIDEMLAKLEEVKPVEGAKATTSEVATADWIETMKATPAGKKYLKAVREYAKVSGIEIKNNEQLRELLTDLEAKAKTLDSLTGKQMEALLEKLAAKVEWLSTPAGKTWLKTTHEGKQFMEMLKETQSKMLESKTKGIQTRAELMGLASGMVTILLAEELATILGIEEPALKFAAVLTTAHITMKATAPLFSAKGREKALLKLQQAYKALPGMTPQKAFAKIFSKKGMNIIAGEAGTMLTGACHGVAIATGYDLAMSALGFEADSIARNHLVNMAVTFGGMYAFQKWGTPQIKKLPGGSAALGAGAVALNVVGALLIADSMAFQMIDKSHQNAYFTVEEEKGIPSAIPFIHVYTNLMHMGEVSKAKFNIENNAEKTLLAIEKFFLLHEKSGLEKDATYYTKLSYKHADIEFLRKYFSKPVFLTEEMAKFASQYSEALAAGDAKKANKILTKANKYLRDEEATWWVKEKSKIGGTYGKLALGDIGEKGGVLCEAAVDLAEVFDIYLMQQAALNGVQNAEGSVPNLFLSRLKIVKSDEFNPSGSGMTSIVLKSEASAIDFLNEASIYHFGGWNATEKEVEAVLASRKEQRMGELFAGLMAGKGLQYNEVDIEMGFVVDNGSGEYVMDESHESYIAMKTKFYKGLNQQYLAAKAKVESGKVTQEEVAAFRMQEEFIKALVMENWMSEDETSKVYLAALVGCEVGDVGCYLEEVGLTEADKNELFALETKAETDIMGVIELAAKFIQIKNKIDIAAA
jgi:adenosine deaminase/GGDEF domain-containing protein/CRP-like cAMP-binding protein